VFATEHWLGPVNDWVCYGAPVHAPDGTQLGVIDLSTSWQRANPLGLTTVATMARLIEIDLRAQHAPQAPSWTSGCWASRWPCSTGSRCT
jgi:transcriptional regulator of acetoin/glycerol metabolism